MTSHTFLYVTIYWCSYRIMQLEHHIILNHTYLVQVWLRKKDNVPKVTPAGVRTHNLWSLDCEQCILCPRDARRHIWAIRDSIWLNNKGFTPVKTSIKPYNTVLVLSQQVLEVADHNYMCCLLLIITSLSIIAQCRKKNHYFHCDHMQSAHA